MALRLSLSKARDSAREFSVWLNNIHNLKNTLTLSERVVRVPRVSKYIRFRFILTLILRVCESINTLTNSRESARESLRVCLKFIFFDLNKPNSFRGFCFYESGLKYF